MMRLHSLKNTVFQSKRSLVCMAPFHRRAFSSKLCDSKNLKITQHLGNDIDRLYTFENETSVIKKHKETSTHGIFEQYLIKAKAYFLPNGYPSSTNAGYGRYVSLQALAYIFASTSSVLSMQCLLYAMGLGENSLPLAATLNWVIKDGFGQLGGVVFAGLVNNQYDSDPKRWRMISAVAMEVSAGIEILTPLAPGFFLPMASVANIGKNISFLSASASRAAIHHSFALKENLADITAKSGSQTILSSLIGTSVGVLVASQIGDQYNLALAVFGVCSSMNILLSYLSLSDVNIHAISANHFDVLFQRYRASSPPDVVDSYHFHPFEFLLGAPSSFFVPLRIGVGVDEAIVTSAEAEATRALFSEEQFIVTARTHNSRELVAEVTLLLKERAGEADLLRGLAVAHVCRDLLHQHQLRQQQPQSRHSLDSQTAVSYHAMRNMLQARLTTTKDRTNNMTFRNEIVAEAIAEISKKDNQLVSEFARLFAEKQWVFSSLLLEKNYARINID